MIQHILVYNYILDNLKNKCHPFKDNSTMNTVGKGTIMLKSGKLENELLTIHVE